MHTVSAGHRPLFRRVRDAMPVRPLGSGLCLVAFAAVYLAAGIPAGVAAWSLGAAGAIGLRGVQLVGHVVVLTRRGVRRGRR